MTITQLIYFREVCDRGGVTAAARATHVSQPTITNAIRDLEKEFSVNLFSRNNKKMILTEEGTYFYNRIIGLVDEISNLEKQMKSFGQKNKKLIIGVPPMIGMLLFPNMFSQFHKQHSDIDVELQEYGSVQTLEMMEDNQMDLAIVIYDGSESKRFASIPILQTELLYCVAKDHRLAEKEVIELADLKEEPLVLMKRGSYQNKEVLRRFQEQGIQPNILLRTEQLYTIEQYILRQEAGGFLFKEIAACNREITGIAVQPKIPISVHLIWDKNKQTPHSAAEFIRFAKQYTQGQAGLQENGTIDS